MVCRPCDRRKGEQGKEYIESEIRHNHLEDYISQVLIPTEKVYTIRNGKKVSKERVSYPGYVLVEAAFVGQIPIIIRNTPNVLGFLGDTKEDSRKMNATPLRPQEVRLIWGGKRNTILCRRDRQGYGRSFLKLPRYH